MSTGAMTGADASALRALAAQMSSSAGRLDAIRQGIRSRLYSVHWDGPDGANFRRMWDGQHVPLLSAVAEGLRDSAERLLADADQQEAASGAGAGGFVDPFAGQTIGPSTGGGAVPAWTGVADSVLDDANFLLGWAGAFVGSMLKGFGVQISGPFWGWRASHADDLNRLLGSASDIKRLDNVLVGAGRVVPGLSGALSGYEQWYQDADGNYSDGERATRAVVGGAAAGFTDYAMEAGAVHVGMAIGTMIAPGVGTVVGGLVGWGVSAAVNLKWGDEISDVVSDWGADGASLLIDVGSDVVDFGGDVLEAGGELLGDARDVAADVWEDITPW